jgi:hypothetical protein
MVEWFEDIVNFTTLTHNAYKTGAVILTTPLETGVKFLITCSGFVQHKALLSFLLKPSQNINLRMYKACINLCCNGYFTNLTFM